MHHKLPLKNALYWNDAISRTVDKYFFRKFPCTKYHLARPYLDTQFLNYLSLDIQRIDSIGTSVFQVYVPSLDV